MRRRPNEIRLSRGASQSRRAPSAAGACQPTLFRGFETVPVRASTGSAAMTERSRSLTDSAVLNTAATSGSRTTVTVSLPIRAANRFGRACVYSNRYSGRISRTSLEHNPVLGQIDLGLGCIPFELESHLTSRTPPAKPYAGMAGLTESSAARFPASAATTCLPSYLFLEFINANGRSSLLGFFGFSKAAKVFVKAFNISA